MVENRPLATFLAHLVLILGAVIVTFTLAVFPAFTVTVDGAEKPTSP